MRIWFFFFLILSTQLQAKVTTVPPEDAATKKALAAAAKQSQEYAIAAQNWIFAGVAVCVACVSIVLVQVDQGTCVEQ